MFKIPFSIKCISLLGIACGIYNVSNGFIFGLQFIFLGSVTIFLSIGLFTLSNLAKISALIFSILFFLFYAGLFFIWLKSNYHFFWGIGLLIHLPIFLWSLVYIILSHKIIK